MNLTALHSKAVREKGPAERAAEKIERLFRFGTIPHILSDYQVGEIIATIMEEYASIEQEKEHLKLCLTAANNKSEQWEKTADTYKQENQRLREALNKIANMKDYSFVRDVAQQALATDKRGS